MCMKGTVEYHTITEVICLDQDKREKSREKKVQEKFNSITESVKPVNQNQEHNVRREGIGPKNNKH